MPLLSNCDGQGRNIFKTLLNNVGEFQQLEALQHEISVDELCDSRVVWHQSCHLKFASAKIERAKLKRKRDANDVSREGRPPKRGSINQKNVCIFVIRGKWASTSANVRNGQRYKTNGN